MTWEDQANALYRVTQNHDEWDSYNSATVHWHTPIHTRTHTHRHTLIELGGVLSGEMRHSGAIIPGRARLMTSQWHKHISLGTSSLQPSNRLMQTGHAIISISPPPKKNVKKRDKLPPLLWSGGCWNTQTISLRNRSDPKKCLDSNALLQNGWFYVRKWSCVVMHEWELHTVFFFLRSSRSGLQSLFIVL